MVGGGTRRRNKLVEKDVLKEDSKDPEVTSMPPKKVQ